MAKLYKFEKTIKENFYLFKLNLPYGFSFDNPKSSFEISYPIDKKNDFVYRFDFFCYGNINYFYLTIHIGSRLYSGLFYEADYNYFNGIVDKFARLNCLGGKNAKGN